MSQNKNITLSLKQKLQLAAEVEHTDKSELCAKYGCSRSTLNRIIKNKQSILEQSKTINPSSKRNRTGKSGEVDRAVAVWFHQMRASGAIITTNMILDKANQFAWKMNKDCKPNSGWLWRWQKRQGISLKRPPKESAATEDVQNISGAFEQYSANDIFNADETSLLFKVSQTTAASSRKDESSQERLTLLLLCNATGDYKKVFAIGKPKIECFQNRILKYYSHCKAWMTQDIWINILTFFDEEMIKENRKVILFIDKAAPHKRLITLKNIQLQYLSEKATSTSIEQQQPMVQGIIHDFKKYYRQNVVLKTVAATEEEGRTIEEFEQSFNVRMALHMIENAWGLVKPVTIVNYFKKCNLVGDSHFLPDLEEDADDIELNETTVRHSGSLEAFEDYVRCDDHLPCWGLLTEEEIIADILPEGSSDENDVVEVQLCEEDPLGHESDDDNKLFKYDLNMLGSSNVRKPAEEEAPKCLPQKNITSLSLKQKLQIISELNRLDKAELCTKYGCSLSTLNRIIKHKQSILEKIQTINPCSKRVRSGKSSEVDRAVTVWFNQMHATGRVPSTNILLEKAQQFALKMNIDYSPGLSWLSRWQRRLGISVKRLQDESKSANMKDDSNTTPPLPTLIAEYSPNDIFNANETALLFKALPTSTSTYCDKNSSLTLLFMCNATGSYRRVFVIGKAKTKRLKNKKILPLKYYCQRKAWMTQEIWISILISLDEEMINTNRKIILFIANVPPHKRITLKNIKLQYLPANCGQPQDEGIVHSFKETYRQNLILKLIAALEEGRTIEEFEKSVNVLRALHMIKHAWCMLKPACVVNSFKKSQLMTNFPYLPNETNEIKEAVVELVGCLENFQIYVRCDDSVPCYGLLTDEEIIAEVLPETLEEEEEFEECDDVEDFESDAALLCPQEEFEYMNYDVNIPCSVEINETEMAVLHAASSDDEEEVQLPPHDDEPAPSISEALQSLKTLQKFFLPQNKFIQELDGMEKYFLANCPEIPAKSIIKIEPTTLV